MLRTEKYKIVHMSLKMELTFQCSVTFVLIFISKALMLVQRARHELDYRYNSFSIIDCCMSQAPSLYRK